MLGKSRLWCASGELSGDAFAQGRIIERGYLLCPDIRRGDDQGDLTLDGIAGGEVCGKLICRQAQNLLMQLGELAAQRNRTGAIGLRDGRG